MGDASFVNAIAQEYYKAVVEAFDGEKRVRKTRKKAPQPIYTYSKTFKNICQELDYYYEMQSQSVSKKQQISLTHDFPKMSRLKKQIGKC